MNKQEGCICGCITLEKPYTVEEELEDGYEKFVIKYKNQFICSLKGGIYKDKYGSNDTFIKFMNDLLNETYQKGFQNCGRELMEQTIKQDNLIYHNPDIDNKDFIAI